MAFHPVARLIDLVDGYRAVVRAGHQDVLVICDGGRTYLVARSCPHAGSPLDAATLCNGSLTCPRHGVEFDLASGRALNAACSSLSLFDPVFEGANLGVDL